jgi:isoleucyl-tRNA synthetase
MAPFTPFFADYLYKQSGGKLESVHLENWPEIEPGIKGEELGILVEMAEVRRVVSLALEARAKANIKIRQPLAELRIKNLESRIKNQDMLTLIADEVNVKEVKIDESLNNEVDLDTLITPELKKEGSVRDFVRAIQELRKEIGLNPKDFVELSVEGDEKAVSFVQSVETELKNSTQLTKIKYESVNNGSGVSFEDFSLKISISR